MATNFKHIEYLPIDEENLILNDDPESNIRSKACINLGFLASNTTSRFLNISLINKNSSKFQNNFLDLSYSLETLLINCVNLNTISNPSNSQITNHYKKRQLNISSNKILPSFKYCQNLTFTGFKTWAGFYGTLNYYINLLEEYNEYYTPSEIAYYSFKSLLDYSKLISYNKYFDTNNINYNILGDFYEQSINVLEQEESEFDKQIYNLSLNIILVSPLIKEIYTELRFYEQWIPKVFKWKSNLNQQNIKVSIESNPSTNKQRAINSLLRVIQINQEHGYNFDITTNVAASFIRQDFNNDLETVVNELAIERKEVTYIKLEQELQSEEEILITEFLNNISKFRNNLDFKKASNIIQECISPPAGYALFLVGLATTLINRAYIITYKNINNSKTLSESNEYKRILKLLGYASILLIKSNLPHAQLLATNILTTFKLYITDINPNNLTDTY